MSNEPEIVTTFSFNLSSELAYAIISLDALIKPTVVDVVAPPTINAPVIAVVPAFNVTPPLIVKPPNVGVAVELMFCGVDIVTPPVLALTVT